MPTLLPTFTMKHFANWGLSILAPYLFLVGGFLVLKTRRGQNRFEKVFDIGYDSCILGIGIAATLLGGSEFQAFLETNAAWAPMVFGFFIIVVLFVLEQSQYEKITQARLSVLVGTLIFGANTAMVAWLNDRNIGSTVFSGILSFVVPCAISYLIIAKLNSAASKSEIPPSSESLQNGETNISQH